MIKLIFLIMLPGFFQKLLCVKQERITLPSGQFYGFLQFNDFLIEPVFAPSFFGPIVYP